MVDPPLVVLVGPTASGKSSLAIRLAQAFSGEIVSCDSVSVYRGLEIGAAKPSETDRALIAHHLLDIANPDEQFTAGDYSRLARAAIAGITARRRLPIVAGGTGLYLRALLDGLFPAPPQQPALRERLRTRPAARLHRILTRLDPVAAQRIHPNDQHKLIRAIEVSLTARRPITEQWQAGREPLTGYRILRLGLTPPRAALYERIDRRAAAMFANGLIEETRTLLARYGPQRSLTSLGYAQAASLLRGEIHLQEAVRQAQQGHRNYAKRQATWFRGEPHMHWLPGFGDDDSIVLQAVTHLATFSLQFSRTPEPLPAAAHPIRVVRIHPGAHS